MRCRRSTRARSRRPAAGTACDSCISPRNVELRMMRLPDHDALDAALVGMCEAHRCSRQTPRSPRVREAGKGTFGIPGRTIGEARRAGRPLTVSKVTPRDVSLPDAGGLVPGAELISGRRHRPGESRDPVLFGAYEGAGSRLSPGRRGWVISAPRGRRQRRRIQPHDRIQRRPAASRTTANARRRTPAARPDPSRTRDRRRSWRRIPPSARDPSPACSRASRSATRASARFLLLEARIEKAPAQQRIGRARLEQVRDDVRGGLVHRHDRPNRRGIRSIADSVAIENSRSIWRPSNGFSSQAGLARR